MKKLLFAGLIGAIAMTGASISGPATAADIVIKAGHTQNAGEPMDKALKIMSEHLEKATGGKATIKIFPSMQLGGEVEMIKQVLTGTLDIVTPSNAPLTNFVPELKIFDMPFLFRDEAHMIKVLRGPVLQDISNIVAKRGIRLLGVFNIGVRHIMSKKPVKSIADLKGLKIRTMQSKYHMAAFNAFGANATPISYAELYSSLQTGVVDGAEAANTNYFEKKFYEVAPHWGQVGWTILTGPIVIAEKKFASLPKDVQKALLEGGNKAAIWEQDYYASVDKGRLNDLKKVGVKITKLDTAPFQKAAAKVHAEFLTTADEKRILKMIQDTK
ncbi:MAG: TRAP transporter substrate-binding protein [Rhodospirillales bacterium]|jgi:tripartite ATP-independent transporter DctP family solute receptor|nr:TRAP transporter substrate-binding protein [Rhodospirillales bacterium]MDP6883451.1 TRAP transporter substrate-binding protein [Rhodospirillales bacterium]